MINSYSFLIALLLFSIQRVSRMIENFVLLFFVVAKIRYHEIKENKRC